jgi:hypothetical protein
MPSNTTLVIMDIYYELKQLDKPQVIWKLKQILQISSI